jgi:hypothetical protein
MPTLTEVLQRFENLDADGVANLLRKAGVRGRRMDEWDCPIARYLTREIGEPVYVNLGRAETGHGTDDLFLVVLPSGVREFIERFDQTEFAVDLRN